MDAEHALDKAAAGFAARAKRALPPQHGVAHRLFGRVIGGLDALDPAKGPERLPMPQEFAAEASDFGVGRSHPVLELGTHRDS